MDLTPNKLYLLTNFNAKFELFFITLDIICFLFDHPIHLNYNINSKKKFNSLIDLT